MKNFLMKHIEGMLITFNLTHFEVQLIPCKKMKVVMDIQVNYDYLEAVIRYGKIVEDAWKRGDKDYILGALCHEITHILVGEITDDLAQTKKRTKLEERAVEHISRLLVRAYQGGFNGRK